MIGGILAVLTTCLCPPRWMETPPDLCVLVLTLHISSVGGWRFAESPVSRGTAQALQSFAGLGVMVCIGISEPLSAL